MLLLIMRYIHDPISEQEAIKRTSKVAQAYNGEELNGFYLLYVKKQQRLCWYDLFSL